jgi:5'(3')-deoxyribonucleotidase
MKRKLQIILDCDDVLTLTSQKVIDLVNRDYGTNYTIENATSWGFKNIQKDLPQANILGYFYQKGFFGSVERIPEAKRYVLKLLDEGHDLLIATDVPKEGCFDRAAWLEEFFPEIVGNLIICRRKDVLKADIMFDDGIHNIRSSICDYPILFEKPWNRSCPDFDSFVHVTGWEEFYALVKDVQKGVSYQEMLRRQQKEEAAI